MKQILPALLVIVVLLYALYLSNLSKHTKHTTNKVKASINLNYARHTDKHKRDHWEEELKNLFTTTYKRQYIVNVINHGSHQLGFPGGEMEGGFASAEDAQKIACYVLELSGDRCKETYAQNAAMFYSSNCAGCHGEDGKGLNGTYPDLTRKRLLGIEKREEFLKALSKKSTAKH